MLKRVLKWDIPVDDKSYQMGAGPVLHVACQYDLSQVVQVWTEEEMRDLQVEMVDAQIVGTGQSYPDDWRAVGSVVAAGGHLVWHVIQHQPFLESGYIKRENA